MLLQWCYTVGVGDMHVMQAVCFVSGDGETHLAHVIFFFTDMNSGVTLMGMAISRDFFLQNRPLRNMFKNEPLLKINL